MGRATDAVVTRLFGLPAARTAYTRREERTPMRDGVVLLGEHYVPKTAHALGTVLVRTPYGRSGPLDVTSARVLAARGYHVLVQSCRGTFGSGGTFDPFATDVDDAHDTVAWLRRQDWFDGRLATTGGSYLGWTQWALMADPPPELKAAVVVVGPHDISAPVYGAGAFSLADFLGWSNMVARQEESAGFVAQAVARIRGARQVLAAYDELPLGAAGDRLTERRAPWYPEWVANPDREAPYWTPRSAREALANAGIPILLVGGWQDLFLRDTIEQYDTLHGRGADVALTVGPWTHIQTATSGSAVIARETLAWFDENLAGATGRTRPAPVRIHVTGADEWRELPEWPPPAVTTVRHLGGGGALGTAPTAVSAAFRYDPADPTPSVGGRLLQGRNGVRDNRELEARPDVVTFTTEPLAADVEIIGTPVVELEHSTDNPHADVFVRLCDVDVTGRSANFSDALMRLAPSREPGVLRLELDPCAHRLAAGHRLRLVVAGGAHPRWARNTGTAEPPEKATTLVPSTHTISGGRVILPACEREERY